jgi:hypothetical protein
MDEVVFFDPTFRSFATDDMRTLHGATDRPTPHDTEPMPRPVNPSEID